MRQNYRLVQWIDEIEKSAINVVRVLVIVVVAVFVALPGGLNKAQTPTPPLIPMDVTKDIQYLSIPGVDPNLLSLDIYSPKKGSGYPVMIMVHGGGWSQGDKDSIDLYTYMPEAFVSRGYVLVAPNYRLTPAAKFPAHAQDVAAAVAWTIEHISSYRGDPAQVFLGGHSAGAHLAALVGTDEAYLAEHRLELRDLLGIVALDTEAYDLPALAARFGGYLPNPWGATFGQDPAFWRFASPIYHIESGKGIPSMAIAYSGGNAPYANPNRALDAWNFANALKAAGIWAYVIAAPEKTHSQIAQEFGLEDDHVTESVFAFLGPIEQLTFGDATSAGPSGTTSPSAPSTRLWYYRGIPGSTSTSWAPGTARVAWLDESDPKQYHVIPKSPVGVMRWAQGTRLLVYASRPTGQQNEQVFLLDTESGQLRQITNDQGRKIDPWGFFAPEYDYEMLILANIDNRELGIYRDPGTGSFWERVATLTLPPDSPHRLLTSCEPLLGGRGAGGRSYFTCQAFNASTNDTSIWLLGLPGIKGMPFIRRLDEGAVSGAVASRLDPESLLGKTEVYVYYTKAVKGTLTELHLCRTGIRIVDTYTESAGESIDN